MNQVTMSFAANRVLALGGRPMMARHSLDAAGKADTLNSRVSIRLLSL
jgi:hydroxyethylthiazole kinase-like sugar kinase family protein